MTTLELDLAVTRDGVLVVSHDVRLNPDHTRAPDGSFLHETGPAIRSLTFDELQRYDVGRIRPDTAYAARFRDQRGMDNVRIPALTEVFDLVKRKGADHIRFNIETKITPDSGDDTPDPESFAALFAEGRAGCRPCLARIGAELRLAHAEGDAEDRPRNRARLSHHRSADGGQYPARARPRPGPPASKIDDFQGSVPRLVQAAGCAVWSPYYRNVTAAQVKEAQSISGSRSSPGPSTRWRT